MKTGAITRQKDLRDFKLSKAQIPLDTVPSTWMPDSFWNMTSVSQGKQPQCGGASGENLQTLQLFLKAVQAGSVNPSKYDNLSMRFLYAACKTLDGAPNSQGTTIKAIAQALQKYGVCREELCQNNVNLPIPQFASWNGMPAEAIADAATRKISSYMFMDNLSFQGIKDAIYQNGACILEMKIGQEWWLPSYNEADIMPLKTPKTITSGHFVMPGAYDENNIYILNSFGPEWARHGFGYFQKNYIPYITDGLVISDSDPNIVQTTQYSLLEKVLIIVQQWLNTLKVANNIQK